MSNFLKIVYKERIKEIALDKARRIYGDALSKELTTRLETELNTLDERKAEIFCHAFSLANLCKKNNVSFGSESVTNPPLIGFLLGLTKVNPLAPHYYCKSCHHIEFDSNFLCGVDMKDKICPVCDSFLSKDGYDIPIIYKADTRETDIRFSFDKDDISKICNEIEHFFASYNVLKFCTKTNENETDIMLYAFEAIPAKGFEMNGIILMPKKTQANFPEGKVISYRDYFKLLEEYPHIGISLQKALSKKHKERLCKITQMVKPQKYDDKIRMSGLFIGSNLWEDNAETLFKDGFVIREIITCREDIYDRLIMCGYKTEDARYISEKIRKGKSLTEEDMAILEQNGVPDWFIQSCMKIRYAPTRGMCVMFAINNNL